MEKKIRRALESNLKVETLEIINESHMHKLHAEGGRDDSHWRIKIKAAELNIMNKVKQHKLIYSALGNIMQEIHALAIEVQ